MKTPKNDDISKLTDPKCIICLEEFNDTTNLKLLSCGHIFHEKCLTDWTYGTQPDSLMGEVMPGRAGLELPSQTRFNCPTCKRPLKHKF